MCSKKEPCGSFRDGTTQPQWLWLPRQLDWRAAAHADHWLLPDYNPSGQLSVLVHASSVLAMPWRHARVAGPLPAPAAAIHFAHAVLAVTALLMAAAAAGAAGDAGDDVCATTSSSGAEPWGLIAIRARESGLPPSAPRVLLCLITSGVDARSPALAGVSMSGCVRQHGMDPGGCILPWNSPADGTGSWKPRGSNAAHIIAARGGSDPAVRGVLSGTASLYIVPVNPESGSIEPGANATGARSRLRAYSACEGRLRGLQAAEYGGSSSSSGGRQAGPGPWRMVVLVDIAANGPAEPLGSLQPLRVTEADWLDAATGPKAMGAGAADVLFVAPAGEPGPRLAFPAAYGCVLAVGAAGCRGQQLIDYGVMPAAGTGTATISMATAAAAKVGPDILAPGMAIRVPDVRSDGRPHGTIAWGGSAAAAAFVAGSAARLWAAFPGCNADAVRTALLATRPNGASAPAALDLHAARKSLDQQQC